MPHKKGERSKQRKSSSNSRGHSTHNTSQSSHGKKSQNNNAKISPVSDAFQSFLRGAANSAGAQFTSRLGSSSDERNPHGNPGEFDLYLFAQSWAPRFCCTNKGQCKAENMSDIDDLSIHGLWPAYSTANKVGRTYPEFCQSRFVPDIKLVGRRNHEWNKHGTCTVLNPTKYFEIESKIAEKDSVLAVRDLLNDTAGDSVAVDDLVQELGGPKKVAVMSNKFCQLEEITTCWAKTSDGSVGDQVDCPDHVLGSSRNSAVLQKCKSLALDQSGEKCAFITKEVLKILKSNPPSS